MTPETLDWKLEAKRVALAFKVSEGCEFVANDAGALYLCGSLHRLGVQMGPDLMLVAEYDLEGFKFSVGGEAVSSVQFFWNGRAPIVDVWDYDDLIFAYALHCLNLLSPTIEAALEVVISAHQKMEWTLEFEQKYQSSSSPMNWEIQATQIKAAFGIESNAKFQEHGGIQRLEADLPDHIRLRVEYFDRKRWFFLQKNETITTIGLDEHGRVVQEPTQFDYAKQMTKALVGLYPYLSEIETALKAEFTDANRIECIIEYQSRIEAQTDS